MKISVIIPTYNGSKTIERAIKSVINQEGNFDLEILICDDLSTDDTIEKSLKYSNIKILRNTVHTGGPNAGRNLGIKNATGDYLAFLDQDDEWLSDKLKKQINEVKNGAELVASHNILRMEKGK